MKITTIKIIALLVLTVILESAEEKTISKEDIFGVRWFLGEKFQLQSPFPSSLDDTSPCHLMLIFNTHSAWTSHTFHVEITSVKFECFKTEMIVPVTSDHHDSYNEIASKKGDTFITYVHKCPVTFANDQTLAAASVLPYTITAQKQKINKLFQAQLKSPAYEKGELSMAVLGDWGVMTNYSKQSNVSEPITDCLLNKMERRQDLRLLLLLGDFGYDLLGQTYVSFLSYLSIFSSRMAILLTPGNHESIRHEDVFLLFKQSFYSPSWRHFYGYFDLVSLRNHVFLGYNSQHLFDWLGRTSHSSLFQVTLKDKFGSFSNMFALQFSPKTRQIIKERSLIAFSHYPTYCSKTDEFEDCNKYRRLQSEFSGELQSMGVDLFLSGHVHMYERTKQLCNGQKFIRDGFKEEEVYQYWMEENCSLFVIEGAAGNNYFVETARNLQLKPFSEKFVGNTGFGILTLNSGGSNDIRFAHVSVSGGCQPADEFIMHASSLVKESSIFLYVWVGVVMIGVVAVGTWISRETLLMLLMRVGRKSKYSIRVHDNVIELAENVVIYNIEEIIKQ